MFGIANVALLPIGLALVGVALHRAHKQRRPGLLNALLQVVAILGAVGAWFIIRTISYLNGPADGDAYAQTWGFQGMVFVLIYLPWALLAAGALVLAETVLLRKLRHAL